jgi:hypothetical protein
VAVAAVFRCRAQAHLTRDFGEVVPAAPLRHPAATFKEEEGRTGRPRDNTVPLACVIGEDLPGGFVDRDQPGLTELRPANPQDPLRQVHVLPIKGQRFADPHPGHREQPEDRRERAALQSRPRRELTGCADEVGDFRVAVDIRPLSLMAAAQQARRRHFRPRLRGVEPDGETSHRLKTHSPGRRAGVRRLLSPAKCQIYRDVARILPLGKGGKAVQQAARFAQQVTQVAAQLKILRDGFVELAHCSPPLIGQGNASERSPWISTFA